MIKKILSLTLLFCCGTYIKTMENNSTKKITELPIKMAFRDRNASIINKYVLANNYTIQPSNMDGRASLNATFEDVKYNYTDILWDMVNNSNHDEENVCLIETMIKNGVNPVATSKRLKNLNPLYTSLLFSKSEVVNILLESPTTFDVNKECGPNKAPLFFALCHGHYKTAREKMELLKKLINNRGADLNIKDPHGNTFLMKLLKTDCRSFSSFADVPVMVEELIKHKPNPNAENNKGEGSLHILAKRALKQHRNGEVGAINCIKEIKNAVSLLAKNDADFNKTDKNGFTPLGVAINEEFKFLRKDSDEVISDEVIPVCKSIKFLDIFISPEQQIEEFKQIIKYYTTILDNEKSKEKRVKIVSACKDLLKYLENKVNEMENAKRFNVALYLNKESINISKKIGSIE